MDDDKDDAAKVPDTNESDMPHHPDDPNDTYYHPRDDRFTSGQDAIFVGPHEPYVSPYDKRFPDSPPRPHAQAGAG